MPAAKTPLQASSACRGMPRWPRRRLARIDRCGLDHVGVAHAGHDLFLAAIRHPVLLRPAASYRPGRIGQARTPADSIGGFPQAAAGRLQSPLHASDMRPTGPDPANLPTATTAMAWYPGDFATWGGWIARAAVHRDGNPQSWERAAMTASGIHLRTTGNTGSADAPALRSAAMVVNLLWKARLERVTTPAKVA